MEQIDYKTQVKKGVKIYFSLWKRPFRVKACNNHFAICVRHHPSAGFEYTIIDWAAGIRGATNQIFNCYDFNNPVHIRKCLIDLTKGLKDDSDFGVSRKNMRELDITKVVED